MFSRSIKLSNQIEGYLLLLRLISIFSKNLSCFLYLKTDCKSNTLLLNHKEKYNLFFEVVFSLFTKNVRSKAAAKIQTLILIKQEIKQNKCKFFLRA